MRICFEKILLAMLLALASTLVGCDRKPSAAAPSMSVYSADDSHGYRIGYPTDWNVTPKTDRIGVSFQSKTEIPGTDSHPYLSVFQQPTVQKDVLEIMKGVKEDNATAHPDFKLIDESDISLAGHSGRKIVFSQTVDGHLFEFAQAIVVIDDKTFTFTSVCSPQAYPTVEPTISEFLKSFVLVTK